LRYSRCASGREGGTKGGYNDSLSKDKDSDEESYEHLVVGGDEDNNNNAARNRSGEIKSNTRGFTMTDGLSFDLDTYAALNKEDDFSSSSSSSSGSLAGLEEYAKVRASKQPRKVPTIVPN